MNYDHIRIVALCNVVKSKDDYVYRHILRWYSKTFYTPLHVVEDLPLDEVLLAYYESTYEEMSELDLEEAVRKDLLSPEARAEEEGRKDAFTAEADKFAKETEALLREAAAKAKPLKTKEKTGVETLQETAPSGKTLKEQMDEFMAMYRPKANSLAPAPKTEDTKLKFDLDPQEDL